MTRRVEEPLTLREVAERLGLTYGSARDRLYRGGPMPRMWNNGGQGKGTRWRCDLADLEAFKKQLKGAANTKRTVRPTYVRNTRRRAS